jgi:hypothetical protein
MVVWAVTAPAVPQCLHRAGTLSLRGIVGMADTSASQIPERELLVDKYFHARAAHQKAR